MVLFTLSYLAGAATSLAAALLQRSHYVTQIMLHREQVPRLEGEAGVRGHAGVRLVLAGEHVGSFDTYRDPIRWIEADAD